MDPEFGYDPSAYDPDYDEIHSANIAEPDYYPVPAPQSAPQSTPAPAPAPRAASAAEPAGLRMPMPETGLREVYLYDESRVHAEIRCEPTGAWIITDLGSLNGVFVNGRRIKSAPLRDADMIRIGTTELEFQDLEQ